MEKELQTYKTEVEAELEAIMDYWQQHAVDEIHGGFVGRIDSDNVVDPQAPKGSVLNSRILWTFSAAFNAKKAPHHLALAHRAYQYIRDHFIDGEWGGVYWTVDAAGHPLDTKKQVYAQSFAVYAMSEYYRASGLEEARTFAIALYQHIVAHSYDTINGGYIEALSRDWGPLSDLRLSEKDSNERKSMNTHLHVLEGFANLYRIWPDAVLREKIDELILIFLNHIADPSTGHLWLFFDDEWNPKGNTISYGHDIEAAWLVQEAAETISSVHLAAVKDLFLKTANATITGLDSDGGLWYEYEPTTDHLVREKHWWPQAEAMVGFFNAGVATGDSGWLLHSLQSWDFIKAHILDRARGEWYWGVEEEHRVMTGQDKVGIWKCPYHNARACMEIMKRVDAVLLSRRFSE